MILGRVKQKAQQKSTSQRLHCWIIHTARTSFNSCLLCREREILFDVCIFWNIDILIFQFQIAAFLSVAKGIVTCLQKDSVRGKERQTRITKIYSNHRNVYHQCTVFWEDFLQEGIIGISTIIFVCIVFGRTPPSLIDNNSTFIQFAARFSLEANITVHTVFSLEAFRVERESLFNYSLKLYQSIPPYRFLSNAAPSLSQTHPHQMHQASC